MRKHYLILIPFFLLINLYSFGQYSISGYLNTSGEIKTVYLSLLRYDEESSIYPEQILLSAKTDQRGYFEITGKLLPYESMLYRIHTNPDEYDTQLTFIESGAKKNYHNFIFSNTDTIIFPQGKDILFDCARNTNKDDAQWRKFLRKEETLINEFSKNQNLDAKKYSQENLIREFKSFCNDSLKSPLVKLLAYEHLRRNVKKLENDFTTDPLFYKKLLDDLNKYYSGTAYFLQYQEEILRLSGLRLQANYIFHKRLNLILGGVVLLLLAIIFFLLNKLKRKPTPGPTADTHNLTEQEKKIVDLIIKGMTNKEISSHLFISLSTVKTHISNINSKLNISNRQELIEKLKNHTGD